MRSFKVFRTDFLNVKYHCLLLLLPILFLIDSPESSFSSATSTTSTGTVVCNFNALKPKNSQSVSQTSLQSTGISTPTSLQTSTIVDKSTNKCHLVKCSYRDFNQTRDVQSPSTFIHHGTIRQYFSKFYYTIQSAM